MPEPELTIHTVPMLDTGIGIEAGYTSDKELVAAAQAERAALPPEQRELLERLDAEVDRKILGL